MVGKRFRSSAILFILIAFLGALAHGMENNTAYTRDGVHFVSKERMEENILYEYAKPGDYREAQVPLDTVVVGASVIPEWATEEEANETDELEKSYEDDKNAPLSGGEEGNYPYAALGLGVLLIVGLVASFAWINSRRRSGLRKIRRR